MTQVSIGADFGIGSDIDKFIVDDIDAGDVRKIVKYIESEMLSEVIKDPRKILDSIVIGDEKDDSRTEDYTIRKQNKRT